MTSPRNALPLVAALVLMAIAGGAVGIALWPERPAKPGAVEIHELPPRTGATLPPTPDPPPSSGEAESVETADVFVDDPPVPVPPPPLAPTPKGPALAALRPPAPPDGVPAWQRHAVPAVWPAGHPAIAVVIDDLGVDRRRSTRVVELRGPLTLAWLTYAQDLPQQTRAARAAGHELLVHMPMEPRNPKEDPGPGAMLTKLPATELHRRLETGLAAFEGYVGLNNHMGSRFTENRPGMSLVMGELRRRGLLFLDSRTTGASVGTAVASDLAVPWVGRDVFIDHDAAPGAVRGALAKLEEVARRQGFAVGIGHPHDVTIEALAAWLPGLEARGFVLVPVSAVVKARTAGR